MICHTSLTAPHPLQSQQDMTWRRSPTFRIASKSATRHWSVNILGPHANTGKTATPGVLDDKNVEYIPTFDQPRLFRWRGYWMEVKSNTQSPAAMQRFMVRNGNVSGSGSITITYVQPTTHI